jgi:D-alanine-D-alanine ligase
MNMKQSPLNVLVVHEAISSDARADELDTLIQAEQVADTLRRLGYRVSILQAGLDLAAVLAGIEEQQPQCVFNLVESLGGDGRMVHFIPALLRTAGVPFTGSDDDAIYLSSQKQLAKNWMRSKGVPTPSSFNMDGVSSPPDTRWIVKSVWEHASFGLDDGCVVNGFGATQARLEECKARYGGEWFAEQFIEGREFNISVLEEDGKPTILPIAEIGFTDFPPGKPKIVGYAAKWDEHAPEYLATPRSFPNLDDRLSDALNWVVNKCWKSFGLNGYARVDIRVDNKGIPWVLEVNANPCLSRDAGFAVAAQRAGIGYEQLIEKIMDAGMRTCSFVDAAPAAHMAYITASGKV